MKDDGWYGFPPPKPGDRAARAVHFLSALYSEIIPTRPAPSRSGALRAAHGALAPTPEISRIVKRLGNHRLSQPQLRNLANLEPDPIVEDDDRAARFESETHAPEERPLSPRQLALWRAVQEAKVQGISLREIARQLGISRNTVRKYARALTQPTNRPHNRGARRLPQLAAKR